MSRRLVAYSDRLSAHPGERVEFKVNALSGGDYRCDIVRLRCGDQHPDGPGFQETVVETPVNRTWPGRRQEIHAGSCAIVADDPRLAALESVTLAAYIWPTTPGRGRQGLLGKWCEVKRHGFALAIDEGEAVLILGDRGDRVDIIRSGTKLHERQWYCLAATYDHETAIARLVQRPLDPMLGDPIEVARLVATGPVTGDNGVPLAMGAFLCAVNGRPQAGRALQRQDRAPAARLGRARRCRHRSARRPAAAGGLARRAARLLGFLARHRDRPHPRPLRCAARRPPAQPAGARHEGP